MRLIPILAICFACIAAPANAQLAIDRLWVDMEAGQVARADIVVRNESPDVYYITVQPNEIVEPGTQSEERLSLPDPEELGLLVTPNRLVLRPEEIRAIRIVSLNEDLATDRIYRVSVTPQIGQVEMADSEAGNRGIALKLLAAFDVLVTVRPDGASPELVAVRTGNEITLRNNGNSNLLLLKGAVCPASDGPLSDETLKHYRARLSDENDQGSTDEPGDTAAVPDLPLDEDGCTPLSGRRLYAGNSWSVVAGENETLRFQSRRSANENFRPLEVRCNAIPGDRPNSDFCRSVKAGADTEAAIILP